VYAGLANLALLICIIFFIANLPLVSAQVISVSSDKKCYLETDNILFQGRLNPDATGYQVNIKILDITGKFITIISGKADLSGNFQTIPFKAMDRLRHETYTVVAFMQDQNYNKKTSFKVSSSCDSGGPPPPSTTYYSTFLYLKVTDGSSQGYIKVKPELTYGTGSKLSTSSVEIYVDGNYQTKVSSNQWSSNIWAGSGTHTIKVSVLELTNPSDGSIKYKAASDTETFVVATSSGGGSGSGTTVDLGFPIEYVIVIIVIAIAAGVAILLAKRKKSAQVVVTPSTPTPSAQTQDDTQFWVCPHCGGDTQYRNGKQYCDTCKVYL